MESWFKMMEGRDFDKFPPGENTSEEVVGLWKFLGGKGNEF